MAQWGAVQAWIKDNVPSPLSLVNSEDLGALSAADKRVLMREALDAQRNWPPRVGSRAWFDALDHPPRPRADGRPAPRGSAVLLWTILRVNRPDLTAERAAEI